MFYYRKRELTEEEVNCLEGFPGDLYVRRYEGKIDLTWAYDDIVIQTIEKWPSNFPNFLSKIKQEFKKAKRKKDKAYGRQA